MALVEQLVGPSGSGLTRRLEEAYRATPGAAMLTADAAAHVTLLRATVAEEIALPLEQRGWAREKMAARVDEVARGLGLSGLLGRDPRGLSGGQTRRLAIAAVTAAPAPLVLLDEPFGGLDGESLASVVAWLEGLEARVVVAATRPWLGHVPVTRLGEAEELPALPGRVPAVSGELDLGEVTGARLGRRRGWRRRRAVLAEAGPVSLRVPRGGVAWLRGPNGAGKSTILRELAGLGAGPGAGAGLIMQRAADQIVDSHVSDLVEDEELRARLGLPGEAHPLDLPRRGLRLAQCAQVLGEGRALVGADEPEVGLDEAGRRLLHGLLADYLSGGGAVVLACHDEAFAAEVASYAPLVEAAL